MSKPILVLTGFIWLVITCNTWAKSVVPDVTNFALELVAPTYSPVALYAGISGTVTIRATINKAGIVRSTKIIEGHTFLNSLARKAAKKWRFNSVPAPDKRKENLVFVFRIEPMNTPPAKLTTRFYPHDFKVEIRHVVPNYR